MPKSIFQKGFSLIELSIAVTIGMLFFGIGTVRYIDFSRTQIIKSAGENIKSNLRDIQNQAISGIKPNVASCTNPSVLTSYKVRQASSTSFASEPMCSGGASGQISTFSLPANLVINSFTTFNYLVLGQGTSNSSQITIKNDRNDKWYALCVNTSGKIEDCGYLSGSNPPVCSC